MHAGRIKRIVSDRGFGFINDTDGREIFFHQSSVVDAKFSDLSQNQQVEFDVEKTPKGPRALNVHISSKSVDENSIY